MDESIYIFFVILKDIIYFTTFLFSLRLITNNNIPNYMRGFYWYPTVAIIMLVIYIFEYYLHIIQKNLYQNINLLSLLFHYSFLGLFILKVMSKRKKIEIINIFFWLFLPIITFFIITDIFYHTFLSFAVANFGLMILCISYYYQLFKTTPSLNLLKDPSFWIITGILFGMSTTIPVSIIGGYLFHNIPRDIFLSVAVIMPLGYGVMHLFFLKAILCSIRQQKVL